MHDSSRESEKIPDDDQSHFDHTQGKIYQMNDL
jgi:hypothetical protein